MLPKWFSEWNAANPTDVFKPAFIIGGVGGAVFATALLVSWGQPYATKSMQTGPRGTGMHVQEFVGEVEAPDPTIAGYVTSEPIIPQEGDPLAVDVYDNVPDTLATLTVANYDRLLEAMRAWTGIPDLLEDPENYQSQVAYSMIDMVQNINEGWGGHVNGVALVGVNCYTCHRGQPVPSEIWFRETPVLEATEGWASLQNRATVTSQSTSLPSSHLEAYLLEYQTIAVHDLESRVAGVPGIDVASIQQTEQTYAFMNYFSNSLGVNCVFCHNSRAFYDPEQVTPQWGLASLGIAMVQEINDVWILPLEDVLPEHRLGPKYQDVGKVACKTCHKGYQRPLQGLDVYTNWPELTSTEGPAY